MNVIVPVFIHITSHSIYYNLLDRSVLDKGTTFLSGCKLIFWMAVLLVQIYAETFERRRSESVVLILLCVSNCYPLQGRNVACRVYHPTVGLG